MVCLYGIPALCGFEFEPDSFQSAVTGGSFGLYSVCSLYMKTVSLSASLFIFSRNNNKKCVCVCVAPAGHRLISISVFLLSQFALFHSTTATSCIYFFFLFLLSLFLSPFSFSICFHSSVMGLVAAPDYMFVLLQWQVVFKAGRI